MILVAVIAGLACASVIVRDAVRYPGDAFALLRAPVVAAWAAAWLVYGVNWARFPAPTSTTLLVLGLACLGSLLILPSPPFRPPVDGETSLSSGARTYLTVVVIVAAAVIVWDLVHLSRRLAEFGWPFGLIQHRYDRGNRVAAYGIPGMEVLHAVGAGAGALGYAIWVRHRRPMGIIASGCGLALMLLSTGRWDVVTFGIWLFSIHAFLLAGRGRFNLHLKQVAVWAVLGVYFVGQGQVMRKTEVAERFARLSATDRMSVFGSSAVLEAAPPPAVPPQGPGAAATGPAAGPAAGPAGTDPKPAPEVTRPCPRWLNSIDNTNKTFVELRRLPRVLVLYFAGPFAALDRAVCENRLTSRQVIFYWPLKIARTVGMSVPPRTLITDEAIDVGIPFNNFTAIYPFLGEVGWVLGPTAWIAIALVLRWFIRAAVSTGHFTGVVAGAGVAALGIRTPWENNFFDGTWLVWALVAAGAWWFDRRARRT